MVDTLVNVQTTILPLSLPTEIQVGPSLIPGNKLWAFYFWEISNSIPICCYWFEGESDTTVVIETKKKLAGELLENVFLQKERYKRRSEPFLLVWFLTLLSENLLFGSEAAVLLPWGKHYAISSKTAERWRGPGPLVTSSRHWTEGARRRPEETSRWLPSQVPCKMMTAALLRWIPLHCL